MRYILVCLLAVISLVAAVTRDDIKSGKVPIRGVNIGGWLVGEYWMTQSSPAWQGVPANIANEGEHAAMTYLGHQKGDPQFDKHRATFITEQDFADISAAGLNTVRITVGYWIVGFDNSGGGDPSAYRAFAPGGINYLDRAIREWAPRHNLLVLLSYHAGKGSQNGNDNSAPSVPGQAYWSSYKENVNNTLDGAQYLALRYQNDQQFLGIGMLNEPRWDQNEDVLKQYYYDCYGRIEQATNCLLTTAPLLNQQGPFDSDWNKFMPSTGFHNIRHEWHKYQVWGFEASNGWNAEKIINYVNTDLKKQFSDWTGNWLYVGEWSLATDGSVTMNDDQLRRYAQAQVNTFASAPGGWTFWTWKFYNDDGGRNGWSMKDMIARGFLKF